MLDLLTLTASKARTLLEDGKTTSVELVEAYLRQIEKHNHQGLRLNAMISVAPQDKVLKAARKLDTERQAGKIRGPLHGIPIVFKDVFTTHGLDLPTTCGAPCFATAKAKRTAPMIQHLIDTGLIVLGTANLTEFCGMKYEGITPGWSPMGGQTQSPYIFGGLEKDEKLIGHSSIGGSSAGSAASVAAGFAPLSIGTECCGSLVTPANRGGLYALKCGLGEVDVAGAFHYTDCTDYIGGMAKSVEDLSSLTSALMQRPEPFDLKGGFDGLRVGFTNVKEWRLPDEISNWPGDTREQMERAYVDSIKKISDCGAKVLENVDLPIDRHELKFDGESVFYGIAFYQVSHGNMQTFMDEFNDCEIHSIEEMIKYNEDHADLCMPPEHPKQDEIHALVKNKATEARCQAMIAEMRRQGHEGLDKLFEDMDVVVALTDSSLCRYTSAAGYPIACVPLSTVKYSEENQRPFGLCIAASKGREDLLLRFMAAFESAFPPRPLPKPLLTEGY